MSYRTRLFQMRRASGTGAAPLMSLVDVVFLLMTFFLFGSIGLRQQQLVADLSRGGGSADARQLRTCWLTLRPISPTAAAYRINGGAWRDRAEDARLDLAEALRAPEADGTVTIDALPGAAFQSVIDAFTLAEAAGARSVAMRTE